MEEELKIIEEPLNFTDSFVVFDPELEKPTVAQTLHSSDLDETTTYESYESDGYNTPILIINQQSIPNEYIESFTLFYNDFLPKIEFEINDAKGDIQYIGGPGLHNIVFMVLCPNVDGIYRSISMPFYIKERINLSNTKIKYICEYYNVGLTDSECMQIGSKPLTTYEFCEEFAKLLKIGFSCTDKCKEVSDPRWRQMYSQKAYEFIKQQIGIGGIDETSIFDVWIDTHGYLNLVNLAWIFSIDVKPENLSIVVQNKMEVPAKDSPKVDPFETQRILTTSMNYPFPGLKITRYYSFLNTSVSRDSGTDASFWCLQSAGDENRLESLDIKMIEDSVEGKANPNQYSFRKVEFIGCEMSEDTPYMFQEKIRSQWLHKKRCKQLTIHLMKPNFGLERGTLVNVFIADDNPEHMRTISQNYENIEKGNREDGNTNIIDDTKEPCDLGEAVDESSSAINPSLTGMYYIDGMEYWYRNSSNSIEQILYLIKKSNNDNNLFHSEASPVMTTKQTQIKDARGSDEQMA